jgi:hypothetical protein
VKVKVAIVVWSGCAVVVTIVMWWWLCRGGDGCEVISVVVAQGAFNSSDKRQDNAMFVTHLPGRQFAG